MNQVLTKKKRFISLVRDTTFKYLFKNSEFRKYLEDIIHKKTKYDLSDYQIIDNEDNTGNDRKDYRFDLLLYKEGHLVIIVMQTSSTNSARIKDYQYLFRKASRRFDQGEKYTEKKTTLIRFCNFRHKEIKKLELSYYVLKDLYSDSIISDIESFEIFLPTFSKLYYNRYDEIDKRLVLFNCKSYEEMESLTTNSYDIKLIQELRRLSMDNEFIDHYDFENVQRKLQNSIRDESYQEGIIKGMNVDRN